MWTDLHQLAASQGGALLARQACELGFTWDDFHAIVVAEGWTRPCHGGYLLPGYVDTPLARARLLQLRRPQLVASHELAAAIHGWPLVKNPELGFTSVEKQRVSVPGGRLYRWILRPDEIVLVAGVRVTTKLRTATDLLRRRDRDTAVIALDAAIRRGDLALDAIAERLEQLAHEPGIRNAWRAFIRLDPKAQSVTESKGRMIMWDREIYPQLQVPYIGRDGKTYYADAEADGVLFEFEGFIYHGDEIAHEDDTSRFNDIATSARGADRDFCRITYKATFYRTHETGDMIVRVVAARKRRLRRSSGRQM